MRIGSPAEAIALGIAYVPEDRRRHGVIPRDERRRRTRRSPCCARIRSRAVPRLRRASGRSRHGFVERFAIKAPSLDTPVGNLSGGNQQKVALARWLATRPAVLILDEPTQGVDVGAKAEIHRLMVDLAAEGLAILMISSELPEILGMSDRIAVMRGGTIVAHARPGGGDAGAAAGAGAGPRGTAAWPRDARGRRGTGASSAVAAALVAPAGAAGRGGAGLLPRRRTCATCCVGNAPVLVAAVGMTLVILARQIDISIGSQFAICGVAAGLLAKAGLPMPLVAARRGRWPGRALGAVNGALVAGLGLPAIVVTLATMVVLREGLRWATEGVWVAGPARAASSGSASARRGGRVAIVVAALVVFAAFAWGLRQLAAGRAVYATGSDPEAARLAGIRPRRVVFAAFVVMGALTGLAALLTADPVHRRADQRRRRAWS